MLRRNFKDRRYTYEKKITFSFAFILALTFGFVVCSDVNAQIVTLNDGFCVNLNSNDTILYQKEIITDEKQLCSLAEKNTSICETDSTTTIYKLPDDTSVTTECRRYESNFN